jgi:hypothetical protein
MRASKHGQVDVVKAQAEFEKRLAEIRASRTQKEAVVVRDDFNVPGFCRHGIPMHCPHCAAVR